MASLLLLLLLICSSFLAVADSSTTIFPREAFPTRSGYLPIDSTSALFFAFYEAQQPQVPDTPILVWLQGGPGCSSLIGNFFELGPYLVSPHSPTLHPNPYSWNRLFGLLFIDSPLGTGFSSAKSPSHIPRDQPTVASHLFSALQSFLSSSPPSFRSRPLFLTGESYAGKYIPAAGSHFLTQNLHLPPSKRINLAGVAIGDGLTHPISQVATHAATAYYSGLINARQKEHLESLQHEAVNLTASANWSAAADARNKVLSWLQNATGLATLYDLTKKLPYQSDMVGVLLNEKEVKSAFGVDESGRWYECSEEVGKAMHEDVMKSVKSEVEELLVRRRLRVLLYQGLYDLRDGVVSTEAWVKEMEWEGLERFLAAERVVWEVEGERAGYVQRSGGLTNVVVAGAGHLLPADQGRSAQVMIEDWVLGKGMFSDGGADEEAAGAQCSSSRKVRAF